MADDIRTAGTSDHPMRELCTAWNKRIDKGIEVKQKRFGKYADEAMKFFDGSHTWMWDEMAAKGSEGFLSGVEGNVKLPGFKFSTNKVSEIVQLFSPSLVARAPYITVDYETPPDIDPAALGVNPMDPQSAMMFQMMMMQQDQGLAVKNTHRGLLEKYINWVQVVGEKKMESRCATVEALIKGESPLWTEMHTPPGSDIWYPKTFYDSIDNLVKDPDAEKDSEIMWIARKCTQPLWMVEKEYQIPPGILKGHMESRESQAKRPREDRERKANRTFDMLEYWKIYSKGGVGDRLVGVPESLKGLFDFVGDYAFMVVAKGVPFPLNVPPHMIDAPIEQATERLQWPIPFWTNGSWPCELIRWQWKPGDVWAISPVKPGIGYLRFINWCFSFLADKVQAASTTLVGCAKHAAEDIRDQIRNRTGPYTVVELSELMGKSIREVVDFLDAPSFHIDLWRMLEAVMAQFDKATGLVEILYGATPRSHDRSAKESEIREDRATIRLDDMADKAEDALSKVAEKEIIAARWLCEGKDVIGPLGQIGAHVWESQILTQEVDTVVRDYTYRVAAGSIQKPNAQKRISQLQELGQVAMPTFQALALQGVVGPFNAFMEDVGDAIGLPAEKYLIPSPQEIMMQQQGMPGPGGPGPPPGMMPGPPGLPPGQPSPPPGVPAQV